MRLKKAISAVAAGAFAAAIALSMSSATAFAAVNNTSGVGYVDGGALTVDLAAEGYDVSQVSGVTYTFTVDDADGFGGGIMTNGTPNGWHQEEAWYWGDPGSNGPIYAEGGDGTYSITLNFGAGEFDGAEDGYAQLVLQQWWGSDITVTGVKVIGGAAAAEETTDTAEESADEAEAQASDDAAAATVTVAKTADAAPTAGIVLFTAAAGVIAVSLRRRSAFDKN